MKLEQVKDTIRKIAKEVTDAEVSDTENLFETGLDSLGVVRLLVSIQEELGLYIAITEIERDIFSTVDQISAYVFERINQ